MSVLGSLAVNKNVYVVRVGDESEMNISHCSEEMKWIHLLKLFVPETHAQPKSFVPTPPSVTNSGGKIREEWGEKRLCHAFSEYNKISVLLGRDRPGQGRCGFALAREELRQSAWAGSRLHPSSFISATLMAPWIKVLGPRASGGSTLKPQPLHVPAGPTSGARISEFLPCPFFCTYPAKVIASGSF